MKKILIFSIFIIVAFVSSCGTDGSTNTLSNKLKVLRWGPEVTKVGVIPNKQPDGKMGIWIDVTPTEGIGEVQVLFAGKPVKTAIESKLITAGVSVEEISTAGDKKVEIQSIDTGEILSVGTFKVSN